MKWNKYLMLGLAGLAFAACSNEEELGNQFPEGTGAVTIKIVSPAMTRSVETETTGSSVTVTGNVTITLEANNGNQTINLTADELAAIPNAKVTFWNVEGPNKVMVSMNGGKASYTEDAPTFFEKIAPASIPAYGETSAITLTGETGSPVIDNDNASDAGNKSEQGAATGDDKKVYQLYTATVNLAIPVARLEVSGIQHVTTAVGGHAADDCKYETLTIAGVYLDNVYATGADVIYANGSFPCASGTPTDYSYDGLHGTGIAAIWKDAATNTDFLTIDGVWPETDGQAYSYYFFGADGADKLPKFKIYFDTSVANDPDSPLPAPRYAMITSYKKTDENGGAPITQFLPGHIYKIVSAKLKDENIIGDEGGNTLYGVEVTVTEATWTVETIDAVWAN